MRAKQLCVCGTLLFLLNAPVHATTIIVVRTDTNFFVGADSRICNKNGTPRSDDACKIRQCGNEFFAMTGIATWRNWDFPTWLEHWCSIGTDGTNALDAFIADLAFKLQLAAIDDGKLSDPEIAFRVILLRFDGEVATVITNNITMTPDGDVYWTKNRCPGDCRGQVMPFGDADMIEKYSFEHPELGLLLNDPERVIRTLINAQAAHDPCVSEPIDILRLTPMGAEWKQRKDDCSDVQGSAKLPSWPRRLWRILRGR